jgi:hypothetical protein
VRKLLLEVAVLCAVSIVLLPAICRAQGASMSASPGQNQASQQAAIAKELGLTTAQISKLKAMSAKVQAQIIGISQNSKLTAQQRSMEFGKIVAWQQKQVKLILTPGQMTKIAAMRAKMVRQMQQQGAGGPPHP